MQYDFEVLYRKGSKHKAADALSRMRTDGNDDTNIHYEFSGELVVSTVNSGLELDDSRPYLEYVDADELEVVNMTTRSAIAQ